MPVLTSIFSELSWKMFRDKSDTSSRARGERSHIIRCLISLRCTTSSTIYIGLLTNRWQNCGEKMSSMRQTNNTFRCKCYLKKQSIGNTQNISEQRVVTVWILDRLVAQLGLVHISTNAHDCLPLPWLWCICHFLWQWDYRRAVAHPPLSERGDADQRPLHLFVRTRIRLRRSQPRILHLRPGQLPLPARVFVIFIG